MLGEAISMLAAGRRLPAPRHCPRGATATDLVLTVTQILRQTGVVGKFVEYFGHGLAGLPLADQYDREHVARVRRHVGSSRR
jgi:aconitate hydratase